MRRLAPQTRIICGVSVAAVCLIAPATHVNGIVTVAAVLSMWMILTRPPFRVVRTTLLLALILFLPYFLLTPLIFFESSAMDWWPALSAPFAVFFHGTTIMMATIFTVTTLSISALRQGLERLPIPDIVSSILIQIVHQTMSLFYETRRMAQAIAVRGGTTGFRTAYRIVVSLPGVWMPRVVDRAERVADAMALRGYCQRDVPPSSGVAKTPKDTLAILVSLGFIGAAVTARLWSAS